jgi:serine protease
MMKHLCWTVCFLIAATPMLDVGALAQGNDAPPSLKALKEKDVRLKASPLGRRAGDGARLAGEAARAFAPSADPAAPNDPAFNFQWHYKALPAGMNAIGAWQKTTGAAEVVVAVLSTGILPKHPDIAGSPNLLPGYSFVTQNGEKPKPDATDPGQNCSATVKAGYEGTHYAGTVGAVKTNNGVAVAGLNWKVSVLPIRFLAKCQAAPLDLYRAILWAAGIKVEGFPVNPHPAHIIMINLSAQVECSRETFGTLIDVIAAVRSKGAIVVAPAGDSAADVKGFLPAGCPGVISVAASDGKGQPASYSNFGGVTLLAPGGDPETKDENNNPAYIWSVGRPDAENKQGIGLSFGTDTAAAHVSGALALALAAHPDWRGQPDLIEQKLRTCAVPASATTCPNGCGAGQLDAARLVDGEGACTPKVAESPSTAAGKPKVAEPKVPTTTPPALVDEPKIATASPAIIEEPKLAEPKIVMPPPVIIEEPKLAKPKVATASPAPADQAPAPANPLAGQWFLPDGDGVLVISPKGDWTHPRHGVGRIREATDQADIAVFYASGSAQCSYRASLAEGGKTLMLFAADTTQDPSYCPSGELKSANR